jgi:hypothetical protein
VQTAAAHLRETVALDHRDWHGSERRCTVAQLPRNVVAPAVRPIVVELPSGVHAPERQAIEQQPADDRARGEAVQALAVPDLPVGSLTPAEGFPTGCQRAAVITSGEHLVVETGARDLFG